MPKKPENNRNSIGRFVEGSSDNLKWVYSPLYAHHRDKVNCKD